MYQFQVDKMSCGGCASRVTKAIQNLDSAARVDVDLKAKQVRVESSADAGLLASAICDAGYPARLESGTAASSR